MRKIKYSNILILGVFIYIIFQVLLLILGKTTTTFLLENEDLEAKITKKGLIIRNEYLVKSPESGELNLSAKEHEKVRKSQKIGSIYMSNNIEDLNKDINALNKEIEELEKTSKSSKNKSSKLSNEITLKNLQTKKEQKEVLISKKNKNMKNINSSISGILSYKFDENEEKYNLENLNSISKEDIKSANNNFQETKENEEKVKEGDTVARIVDNNNMYIAVYVDKKESKLFKINQEVCIGLKSEKMNAKVEKMYKDEESFVIIFKISEQNVGIYDTRVEEFDIIYKQIEGLKIPKESIKTVDDKQGVYVVNEQTQDIEFKELKGIEYENDDFIFIDYYKNDINNIKTVSLYDEIILKPNNINKNIKILK